MSKWLKMFLQRKFPIEMISCKYKKSMRKWQKYKVHTKTKVIFQNK